MQQTCQTSVNYFKFTIMKTKNTFILLLVLIITIPELVLAVELSKEEKEGIRLMREEEKLAQDVYLFLFDQWGIPVFSNISNAETRHFDAVGYLLETFVIPDPALHEMGKFQNEEISYLYDSLTQKGSESIVEALRVGAFIEEFDIADLQKLLVLNTDPIIEGVYQNLLCGSNNHLRAFTGQLKSRGEIYTPVI